MKLVFAILAASLCRADSLPEALREKRYPAALAFADAALASHPRDLKLLTARGIALGGMGRDIESLAMFEKALRLAPNFLPALQGAVEISYRSRDARAPAFLGRLLRMSPANGVARAMAGVLAFEAGDCATAIQHFERGMTEIAGNDQAYPLYGACLLKTKRALEAVEVFERLLAKSPDNANVRFNLGYVQLEAHRPADAVDTLKLLAEAPDAGADVLNLLASAESASGQWDGAIAHLQKAVGIAPDEDRNYVDLAAIYIQQNALEAASEIADIGLKHAPASARLHSMRGIIRVQTGRVEEAAAEFDLANRLDSKQEYGAAGLGLLYTETRQTDQAVAVLRARLKKIPSDFMLNYLLAQAMMNDPIQLGTPPFKEARTALLTSIRAKPAFTKARTLLGKLYAQVGENEQALVELKVATAQDRTDRKAFSQLAIVLRRLGRTDQAAAALVELRQLVVQESESTKELKKP